MPNKQTMPNSQKDSFGNAALMWRMLGLARPLAGWMVIAIACGVMGFCCATGIPVLAAEAALCIFGSGALACTLSATVAILTIMAVARGILHFIEQRCNHYIAFRLLAHVRDLVFSSLRRLTPAKLAGADRGDLISTVTADVELLEVFYAHTISPICIAALMACVMASFLGTVAGLLPAVFALASHALVGAAVPMLISRASGAGGQRSRNLAGALSSFVLDSLRGLSEVLQFDAGTQRLDELVERSAQLVKTQRELRGHAGRGQAATTGLIMVLSCLQVLLCLHLAQTGSINPEGAVLASVATFSSFGPFVALANLGSTLQGTLAAGRRVIAVLDEKPQVVDVSNKDGAHPAFSGIAAEHVDFSYGDEQILDNASIAVEPGQIVGIQGRSGSGKSTLCRLFMRFWDVDKGSRLHYEPARRLRHHDRRVRRHPLRRRTSTPGPCACFPARCPVAFARRTHKQPGLAQRRAGLAHLDRTAWQTCRRAHQPPPVYNVHSRQDLFYGFRSRELNPRAARS